MKRIIICADGTWNRPEQNLKKDIASNVLRLARAIKPGGFAGVKQQVFYDWGIGSYHDQVLPSGTLMQKQVNVKLQGKYLIVWPWNRNQGTCPHIILQLSMGH